MKVAVHMVKEDIEKDPLWYKDAIIYEVRIRSFYDSNGDGIGDFSGLTQKLDYLKDLGVTALWLLPFYPSPLKDDGYDISNYTDVHSDHGTLADFKKFLKQAHQRGLYVITELVLNHTSDQHAWFQKARSAKPNSKWRNFYIWSQTPEKYKDARIIFKDFERSNWGWDPVANAYYWHRFYSHQPDLNYENRDVRKAMLQVVDFWLGMGIDGLRLDAVPYLYKQEGTNCENLPQTHVFLKELRRHVDQKFKNRMLLAEANQWPEDVVEYFGKGDECHMAFHFPMMPRMFMSIQLEDNFPLIDIFQQTPHIPENCQWALFLRNHDELTLEMVTDEERDYMYRMYAHNPQARINLGIRRRLATLLGNDRKKMELMHGLLFSLPGTPVLYYADEIGMGDNIYLGDRDSVRTPMQWNPDRNAGFSQANPQRLYLPVIIDPEYHYETVNVENQLSNANSFLWWTTRLIALRKHYKAFGKGTIEFLDSKNPKIIAFIRRYQDEIILVVANFSRFVQYLELDLSTYNEMIPFELFGQTEFPVIHGKSYLLTLGPHAFYWFGLNPKPLKETTGIDKPEQLPLVEVKDSWKTILKDPVKQIVEKHLIDYIKVRRWYRSKTKEIKEIKILESIPCNNSVFESYFCFLQVRFTHANSEMYWLPFAFASGAEAEKLRQESPQAIIANLKVFKKTEGLEGALYDALYSKEFCKKLLETISKRKHLKGLLGKIMAKPFSSFRLHSFSEPPQESAVLEADQSNTSIVFGSSLFLKVFRYIEEGVNPELEIMDFLTEKAAFPHISKLRGSLEYKLEDYEPVTLAILQDYVPNQSTAWQYTLDELQRYFEKALTYLSTDPKSLMSEKHLLEIIEDEAPKEVLELMGTYLEEARLIGVRTAELHVALASSGDDPAFRPEPLSPFFLRSIYQSRRNLTVHVCQLLKKQLSSMTPEDQELGKKVLANQNKIIKCFETMLHLKTTAQRMRCHGDYHLGQLLYTGKDFVIIDFEGEPFRMISERKIKKSPLKDVAGMLRSFDYAAYFAVLREAERRWQSPEAIAALKTWGDVWKKWASAFFLKAYLKAAAPSAFLPAKSEELRIMLDCYILEKTIYELGYELNNRPDWIKIPLHGIQQMIECGEK